MDFTVLNRHNAFFRLLQKDLQKFTTDWNKDEKNRDKAVLAIRKLA